MKAPDFWWRPAPTLAARALAPAGAVYGAITARRMAGPGRAADVPVLCIGNLVAGGAGKTPAAIAIARLLQAGGHRPAFLSRGYGRTAPARPTDVLAVDLERHGAAETGDEPLLLARVAPTFVSVDRVRAAAAAVAGGADCVILDDGLQNPALRKTWTLAVADGASGIGNGLCIPAGPLRAPVERQWPAVSLLTVIGRGEAGERLAILAEQSRVPIIRARLLPDPATLARWAGRRLYAFAGIGRPEKAFATLRDAGLDVVGRRAFPDHHVFGASELRALQAEAAARGALLVTTTKDKVRLPEDFPAEALPVDLVFEDVGAVLSALHRAVAPSTGAAAK